MKDLNRTKHNEVECPSCGEVFDVNEQMRAHIEKGLRNEISQNIRADLEQKYESRLNESMEDKNDELKHLKESLEKANEEKKKLKNAERELEMFKLDQEQKILDAVHDAEIKAKTEMSTKFEERFSERLKQERSEQDLEIQRLKLQIERQNKKVEDLQNAATNSELEGEALEKLAFSKMKSWYPTDELFEVPKGAYGADIQQSVKTPYGVTAGKILYECKYHKNWNSEWIDKIRKDGTGFDIHVIVCKSTPEELESFGQINGVFICKFYELEIVSNLLRHAVLRSNSAVVKEAHKETIQQKVSEYISGPEFKFVMVNVVNAYKDIESSIRKEEQYMKKQWKSRRTKLQSVVDSLTEMLGQLDAIGSAQFNEIEFGGFMLDAPDSEGDDDLE